MKRKVIQIADSTQLISLPRKWAVKYGIKKGDELDIIEEGDKLTIKTESEQESESKLIDLRQLKDFRNRTIIAAYLHGYDELEVSYDTDEWSRKLQELVSELPGYDIIRQGMNSCTIKEVSKPSPKEFENMANRLFLSLHESGEYLIEAASNNYSDAIESIKFRDYRLHKNINFCKRIINKRKDGKIESTILYSTITLLEHYGDAIKDLAIALVGYKGKVSKEVLESLREINDIFKGVYKLYQVRSIAIVKENANKLKSAIAKINSLYEVQKKIDQNIYYRLKLFYELTGKIQESLLPIIV